MFNKEVPGESLASSQLFNDPSNLSFYSCMVCSKLEVWGNNVQMVKGCLPHIHPPLPFPNQAQIFKDPLLLLSFFREKGSLPPWLILFPLSQFRGKQATWAGPVRGRLGMPGGNPSISVPRTRVGKHVASRVVGWLKMQWIQQKPKQTDRLTVTQSNPPEARWDAEQAQMTSVHWLWWQRQCGQIQTAWAWILNLPLFHWVIWAFLISKIRVITGLSPPVTRGWDEVIGVEHFALHLAQRNCWGCRFFGKR